MAMYPAARMSGTAETNAHGHSGLSPYSTNFVSGSKWRSLESTSWWNQSADPHSSQPSSSPTEAASLVGLGGAGRLRLWKRKLDGE
eukprot:2396310-Rhodomonas_salina.2